MKYPMKVIEIDKKEQYALPWKRIAEELTLI